MTHLLKLLSFFIILPLVPISCQINEPFFAGFQDAGTNLTLIGAARIEKSGVLRLTNDTSKLIGRGFYASPFQFKNKTDGKVSSFSTTFAFAIVPEYPKLGGHGLAFTVSTSKDLNALPSQYLGLFNATNVGNFTNHLFAVEFDTVQDFEFGDINDNHVGIDINDLRSNASAAAAYYTEDSTRRDLNLKSGEAMQAWIDYDSVQQVLNVTIAPTSERPIVPILSFPVDLSTIFEDYMYVGFSASTGLLASSHYILGWSFKMNGQAQSLDLSSLPPVPGSTKDKHLDKTIGVSVASVFLAIFAISLAVVYFVRKVKNADIIEDWELEVGPHRYSYQELKKATRNFSEKELLGRGGFGQVYKGTLPNSKIQVAVKRISNNSKQGLREFVSEIASIGRVRHRNLVQLMGWCRRREDFLLVYDFMANGSLDKKLFDEPKVVLNWGERFKIIKDVALGLLYLHEGYEQVVIHRDVKASNVLLDDELNGRLGDFGLARLYEHGSNPSTTRVVGTLGYLAPELSRTGKATESSDVYAFGAFLLEVTCGRRPIEPKASPEEVVLVDWAWKKFAEGRALDVVDKRLGGHYSDKEAMIVLKLGIMCSDSVPVARPNMRQVARYLDGEVGLPENLRPPDGFAEGFDDLVKSLASSSSFDKMSSHYGYGGASFASISTTTILQGRGESS